MEESVESDIDPLNNFADDNYDSLNGHFSDISPDINELSQDSKATAEYDMGSETTRIKTVLPNLATTVIRPLELTELVEPTAVVATQVVPLKNISSTLESVTEMNNETVKTSSLGTISSTRIKDEPIDDEPIVENAAISVATPLMGTKLHEKLERNINGVQVKEELLDGNGPAGLFGSKLALDSDDVFDPLFDAEDFTDDELFSE